MGFVITVLVVAALVVFLKKYIREAEVREDMDDDYSDLPPQSRL